MNAFIIKLLLQQKSHEEKSWATGSDQLPLYYSVGVLRPNKKKLQQKIL